VKDFTANGTESQWQQIFSSEKTATLLKALKESDGVDFITTPKVITANGRQAQVQVTDAGNIGGETYHFGPIVNIVPSINQDGSSIDLTANVSCTRKEQTSPSQ
jgi:hypothetical protein